MPYEKVLLVIVAFSLLYWLHRIRKKGIFKRYTPPQPTTTTITGYEVRTPIMLDTSPECFRLDGLRFGEDFRLKTAPPLPCNDTCQCKLIPLSYTSTEVFQGALRKNSTRETEIGTLEHKDAQIFKEMLLNLYPKPNEDDFEEYCKQFSLDQLSEEVRQRMKAVVQSKFEQVKLHSPSNLSRSA